MRIIVAKDEVFNFIYKANIDSLSDMGEVCFFSPLHDRDFTDCDLLYLPGGYPELYLEDIFRNSGMTKSIREYAENGGKVYAECGGFMYLCKSIDDTPMCGVLPLRATMANARLHLGYRQMEWETDWGRMPIRGHEFHYSDIIDTDDTGIRKICCQFSAKGSKVATAIYRYRNVIAGYTHWYWAEKGFPFFKRI